MTSYETVIERFMRKIKQDKDYFCINGVTDEEFEEILNRRSVELLDDAVNELQPQVSVQQNVDFLNKDDLLERFNFDLTPIEVDILSDMMVCKYFDEELIKLKTMQKYLGDDIKVFSPANERRSYIEMIGYKREIFLSKIANYNTINRLTGKFLLPY